MLHCHKKCLFYLFLLLVVFLDSFGLCAQDVSNTKIKLSKTTETLEQFLTDFEANSSFVFSYSNKINLEKVLSFPSKEISIFQFLEVLSDSCSLDYSIANQKVILEPRNSRGYIVYGHLSSKESGEWLIGASVVDMKSMDVANTNSYGFYSIKVFGGVGAEIGFSHLGYNAIIKRFNVNRDTLINIQLENNTLLDEVSVVSDRNLSVANSQMSAISLNSTQVQKVPAFLGEADLVKTLQLLPGIHSGSEGFSGLNVRGGGNEQNLILLDDVPLYGITHLLGMFSVFNSDAINQVTVLKGGFPARYGGRASSVIDLKMREGNDKRLNGIASIGLSSAKIGFDGPAIKGKSTFSLAVRRTFQDNVDIKIPFLSSADWNFYFYDVYFKYNHTFSPKSRLFGSFFTSYDKFDTKYNRQQFVLNSDNSTSFGVYDSNKAAWGNVCGSIRWNYLLKSNLFCNSQLAFTQFRYRFNVEEYKVTGGNYTASQKNYFSGVTDGIAKVDFDYSPSTTHSIKFGGNYTMHFFQPGVELRKQLLESKASIDTVFGGQVIHGNEIHVYVEDDIVVSRRVKLNCGIRILGYVTPAKVYFSPEPRLSFRYLPYSKFAIKAAYSRTSQFVHLVNSSLISLPTDLWFPVTRDIKPLLSNLYSIGYEWEVFKHTSFSAEGYYKSLKNVLDVKDGSGIFGMSPNLTDQLTSGNGWSYGIEFLMQIKSGKLTGWLGYTLSKTMHRFNEINKGIAFPARFDRKHDASLSLSYNLLEGIELGANWVFGTGNAITLPTQQYFSPAMPTSYGSKAANQSLEMIGSRNSYRMPNYHRLDLSVSFSKKKKWGERIWSLGVYNAYGRQNPFFLYFKDGDKTSEAPSQQLMQYSIFPIPLPYIRLTAKF